MRKTASWMVSIEITLVAVTTGPTTHRRKETAHNELCVFSQYPALSDYISKIHQPNRSPSRKRSYNFGMRNTAVIQNFEMKEQQPIIQFAGERNMWQQLLMSVLAIEIEQRKLLVWKARAESWSLYMMKWEDILSICRVQKVVDQQEVWPPVFLTCWNHFCFVSWYVFYGIQDTNDEEQCQPVWRQNPKKSARDVHEDIEIAVIDTL